MPDDVRQYLQDLEDRDLDFQTLDSRLPKSGLGRDKSSYGFNLGNKIIFYSVISLNIN